MDLKKTYCTAQQKSVLIEELKNDDELNSGKFSSGFTTKESERRWDAISAVLNAMPTGAVKTGKQWKKTWQDMRCKAKGKAIQQRHAAAGTGGGPPLPPLNREEEEMLDMMTPVAIYGDESVIETPIKFNFGQFPRTVLPPAAVPSPPTARAAFAAVRVSNPAANTSLPLVPKLVKRVQVPILPPTIVKSSKRITATKRLERSITATDKLALIAEKQYLEQTEYHKEKLRLLRESVDDTKRYYEAKLNFSKYKQED